MINQQELEDLVKDIRLAHQMGFKPQSVAVSTERWMLIRKQVADNMLYHGQTNIPFVHPDWTLFSHFMTYGTPIIEV